jgi:D-serine deaminase-like pyridoxal phosphate-dependent protein
MINDLKTPAFLIDLQTLHQNINEMAIRAKRLGVRLRPHVKTHKTIEIARMQAPGPDAAITVSTLAEAHFFRESGFQDITYACPLAPNKIPEAAQLGRDMRSFNLLLDHPDTLVALESYGRENKTRFSVFLKIDCGYHRAGVNPEKSESYILAEQIHNSPYTEFRGILTHAGHSYHCHGGEEIAAVARQERKVMVRFAEGLKKRGIQFPTVSVGSTPTAVHAQSWEGVSELRPGNYVFFDKFMADLGVCTFKDCAATILTSIVGHYPERNLMLVDAGALALSKDMGAVHIDPEIRFGAVVGYPDLRIKSISQELGIITCHNAIRFKNFPIGSRLRIMPNHSCLSAALFPAYHVIEENRVVATWVPHRGW